MQEQDLSSLIDQIYEVPLTHGGWSSVVPMLEERLRARVAIFKHEPMAVSTLAACGPADPTMVREYEDNLWREDRGMQKLRSTPTGEIVRDSDLITDRERTKSPFYNDYLATLEAHRGLYASVSRSGSSIFVVSAQRSAQAGDYECAEVDLLRRLTPHLQRAFRTWQHVRGLEEQRLAALGAVDHASIGLALVDKHGKLHFANDIAREQMAGGSLTLAKGRVTSRSPVGAKALDAAIQAACSHRAVADRVRLPIADGGSSSVLVSPVRNHALAQVHSGNLAMLLLGGQESRSIEETAIGRAYGLTTAEARLLAALIEGERLADYARRHGISVTTAKTHLNALFDKVGERRQVDLIRRAVSDPGLAGVRGSPFGERAFAA